jgi:RNA recognition motif-containing protein
VQGSKLFVANIDISATYDDVKDLFSNYGEVTYLKIIEDRGFAFLEMSNQMEAEKAKKELNGADFKGRSLKVNEARPQKSRKRRHY